MAADSGGRGSISVGALIGGVVGVLALVVTAFGVGHQVGQGDTEELEWRLDRCGQDKQELTQRLAELDEAEVKEVEQEREVPDPPAGETASASAYELQMTPGQTVELPGSGILVEVEDIETENGQRRATISVSRGEAEETASIAAGEQAEVAGSYVRAMEIEAARVKLYVEG